MRPRKITKQEKRVQVNFVPSEFEIVRKKASASGETVPAFLRRVVMELLTDDFESKRTSPRGKIEDALDLILLRMAKHERIQRFLLTNTALARGYAIGVLDSLDQETNRSVQKNMLEIRDRQRAVFFDLYPELRDENS
jgi:hypothetical protein